MLTLISSPFGLVPNHLTEGAPIFDLTIPTSAILTVFRSGWLTALTTASLAANVPAKCLAGPAMELQYLISLFEKVLTKNRLLFLSALSNFATSSKSTPTAHRILEGLPSSLGFNLTRAANYQILRPRTSAETRFPWSSLSTCRNQTSPCGKRGQWPNTPLTRRRLETTLKKGQWNEAERNSNH